MAGQLDHVIATDRLRIAALPACPEPDGGQVILNAHLKRTRSAAVRMCLVDMRRGICPARESSKNEKGTRDSTIGSITVGGSVRTVALEKICVTRLQRSESCDYLEVGVRGRALVCSRI